MESKEVDTAIGAESLGMERELELETGQFCLEHGCYEGTFA